MVKSKLSNRKKYFFSISTMSLLICLAISLLNIPFFIKISLYSSVFIVFLMSLYISQVEKHIDCYNIVCKKDRLYFLILVLICTIFAMVLINFKFKGYYVNLIYQISIGLCVFGVIASLLMFWVDREAIAKIYTILGISFGFSFMTIFPVGVVPDEAMHIYTAYSLSNQIMNVDVNNEEDELVMRDCDAVYPFHYSQKYYNKENLNQYYLDSDMPASSMSSHIYTKPLIDNCLFLYIIPALGITIGRLLTLNSIQVFCLGRIFNLLAFVFITAFCIYKIKKGKNLLFVIALLPCTLQQSMGVTYDNPINCLFFLIFTYMINIFYFKNSIHSKYEYIMLIGICGVLALVKSNAYIFISILPLLLLVWRKAYSRFGNKIYYVGTFLICTMIACVFYYFNNQPKVILSNESVLSIKFLIQNPKEIFTIMYNTIVETGSYYLDTFVGRYLGYLCFAMHPFVLYIYYFLLLLASCKKENERQVIPSNEKILFIFISLIETLAIITGMLLANSTFGDHLVLGMQGRYLMPCVLLILLCFENKYISVSDNIESLLIYLINITSIFMVCNFMLVV